MQGEGNPSTQTVLVLLQPASQPFVLLVGEDAQLYCPIFISSSLFTAVVHDFRP